MAPDDDPPRRPTLARRVLMISGLVLLILAYVLMGAISFLLVRPQLD
ncbi:hypothetical protein [Nonomuraea insulae]|uniref:Uncharacterized protein n=1 Tax=Nonomuraea insulae TaxID=1616787 RepID=A0ABW1CNY0_9ACTN